MRPEVAKRRLIIFFCFSFVSIIPCLQSLNVSFDEVWRRREREAMERALSAYNPNPHEITNSFNERVNEALMEEIGDDELATNSTDMGRRSLLGFYGHHLKNKKRGPCAATNPIDRCWRCRANWAKQRKRLSKCAMGFGYKTIGGRDGRIYVVNDNSDDVLEPKPGTLRHAVIQKEPLWIIFDHDMVITLKQELIMTSCKTIDGRGARVHIAYGAGITIQFVDNVIIHGIKIHHISPTSGGMIRDSVDHYGYRLPIEGDGVSIYGSTNIWLDHLSMSHCSDGLIDAVQGSTAITVSNCHFTHHDHVMLLGASDSFSGDKFMQVTVAFNHFGKKLVQRMPRVRWGFIHVVNNDYTHWEMYAIGGSQHPTVICQGNRFIAPDKVFAKEVTHRVYASESEWKNWVWITDRDMFVNGAYFRASGPQTWPNSGFAKRQFIKARPARFVGTLTRSSGRLKCQIGKKC